MLNTPVDNPRHVENVVVLLTKFYIYRSRCLKEKLTQIALKKCIQEYHTINFNIAKNRNMLEKHALKWQDVHL